MNIALFISGLFLLIIIIIDILQTTFYLTNAGFISGKTADLLWRSLLIINKKIRNHFFLGVAGSSIILITIAIWFILFWTSFFLMYLSYDYSVIESSTGLPAGFIGKLYFTGFSITTLGVGDYTPNGGLWQIISVFAAGLGFIFLTLTISYLISLISSVVEKRKFAAFVYSIGDTPERFINRLYNSGRYPDLSTVLSGLIPIINSMREHHLAYPAVHYFHSSQEHTATAPAIAILDEALSLLDAAGVSDSNLITPAKNSVSQLLGTLEYGFFNMEDETPPFLYKDFLSEKGYDLQKIEAYFISIGQRRKLLLSYLRHDGWNWNDIAG